MTQKDEKISSSPNSLFRLILCVFFAALFVLPAWQLAMLFMPEDCNWQQVIAFNTAGEQPLKWQAEDALDFELLRFRNIANRRYPEIARYLNYSHSAEELEVTLWLRVSEEYLGEDEPLFTEQFSAFITDVIEEAKYWAMENNSSGDSSRSRLNKWVDENEEKLRALDLRKKQMQLEIDSCEQSIIVLQYESGIHKVLPEGMAESFDKDLDLDGLKAELRELDEKQKLLDREAASAVKDEELRAIDSKRNDVFVKRQDLIAKIDRADNIVSDALSSQNRLEESAEELAEQMKRAKEKYNSAKYKMSMLDGQISDVKYDIDFMKQFIPVEVKSVIGTSSDVLLTQVGNICLTLKKPIAEIKYYKSVNMLQKLAVCLAGCFGWALGLVVSRVGRRKPATVFEDNIEDCSGEEYGEFELSGEEKCLLAEDENDILRITVDEEDEQDESITSLEELANLNGFESWWVESYDKIAFKLSENISAMADGIIVSSLNKAVLSPRFIVNLSISLALNGNKVLLVSASDDMALENIFADFAQQDEPEPLIDKPLSNKPGFWDCLRSDMPFAGFASESPLENLRFLHAGSRNSEEVINNEFNNNSDYAEVNYDTDFDCILIYLPELLVGGINSFENQLKDGPITSLISQFRNIAVVDLKEKPTARKQTALKKALSKFGCSLIEL